MNQAGSENKCPKRVSNESILNNYNFDDVTTDHNSICENCKQNGCAGCGKDSCHVGTVSNTEHVVEVAEVSQQQQQQTGTNYLWPQSLLQKAWVYLQSVITTRISGCQLCNPNSPSSPSVELPSQSSVVSFLSSTSSPSPSPSRLSCQQSCLSCMTSCHRGRSQGRSPCPRASSPCRNARPACSRAFSPCTKPPPPCPDVKSLSSRAKQTYPRPNTKSPSVRAKRTVTKPNAKQTSSDAEPTCPHAKPSCLNANCPNPKCPNAKPSCKNLQPPCPYATPPCPNAKCPNAKPSCPSLQTPCPHAELSSPNTIPPCPYATPPCPNAKCPNAKLSCPSLQPPCSHAKPPSSKGKPPCPYAKPPCPNAKYPNAKPSCPSLQPPCLKAKPSNPNLERNSKTSLYHSFSNDSLSSICKESLVELAKVYINKLTSDHKIRCPRCAKRPTCANSQETMASYLRSIFDQAWSYFNTSTELKTGPPQCVLSNYSITSTSSRISESPSPNKSRCHCSKSPKTQSCEAICCPKPVSTKSVICPTCLTPINFTKPVICPKPVSCPVCLKPATCVKPATCHMFYKCEATTAPAQSSKEEGTHEHKSCYTPCCMHNSQGVQSSYIKSEKSCWPSQTSMTLNISRGQVKTPQSVEELKASVTGVTCSDKSSGNKVGCEILDFRSTIEYSKPCVQDLKVSKDLISATDIPPKDMLGFSLTLEQKDDTFGYGLKDLKHLKESLDNCEEPVNSCNDLQGQTCKEEAPCLTSGGRTKSDEVLLEKVFDKPREQVHSKEKICKSGSNSVTCVDSNHPDPKDCNVPEKDAHRKDPYNYKYYY